MLVIECVGHRINRHDFVFVFDVVVDRAMPIRHRVFGAAADRYGSDDLFRDRINHGRVVGFPVHGEDVLGSRVVDNAIRIAPRLDMTGGFQRLQIEDNDFVGAAVADETMPEVVHHHDAVHALQVGDAANNRTAIRIHNFYFRVVRNIQTPGGSIERDVIPILLATRSCT